MTRNQIVTGALLVAVTICFIVYMVRAHDGAMAILGVCATVALMGLGIAGYCIENGRR
jgi:hypothetical protein